MQNPPPEILTDIAAIKKFDFAALENKLGKEFRTPLNTRTTTWLAFRKSFPEYTSSEVDPEKMKPTLSEALQESLDQNSASVPLIYRAIFTQLAQVRLARLALVKAWQLEHQGELPDSLQALVPDYLSALPIDPFDGKPLRYDKQKRQLWSASKSLTEKNHPLLEIVQMIVP